MSIAIAIIASAITIFAILWTIGYILERREVNNLREVLSRLNDGDAITREQLTRALLKATTDVEALLEIMHDDFPTALRREHDIRMEAVKRIGDVCVSREIILPSDLSRVMHELSIQPQPIKHNIKVSADMLKTTA